MRLSLKKTVSPFEYKSDKCICGKRLKAGKCTHCDGICKLMAFTDKTCKRCKQANYVMFIKHYVEDNYFVGFDPDVEELRAKLFREAEKARHREEYGLGDES